MRVLITGGGGFLGHQLARELLRRGHLRGRPLSELILLDRAFAQPLEGRGLRRVVGDVAQAGWVREAAQGAVDVVFHLASMVSGECEEDFDAALRVNLDGGREVFAAARASGPSTVVVFASSIACYGGLDMSLPMDDLTKHLPQTTYGMTKAMGEMLVNDHSRKGHFDGRSVRLPTVIIRPGKPNAAASSWASGMFREPLNGELCVLPISLEQPHPMTDDQTVVDSLRAVAELDSATLGGDRALVLPAHRVTPRQAMEAVRQVVQRLGLPMGDWELRADERIAGIVARWPQQVDGRRALDLGLPRPMPLEAIVERYLRTFGIIAEAAAKA
jgi:nucleoside-diphosphate-sugar epimerase